MALETRIKDWLNPWPDLGQVVRLVNVQSGTFSRSTQMCELSLNKVDTYARDTQMCKTELDVA